MLVNCPRHFPVLANCCLRIRNFHRLGHKNKCVNQKCNGSLKWNLYLQCDLHVLSPETIPRVAMWIHEIPLHNQKKRSGNFFWDEISCFAATFVVVVWAFLLHSMAAAKSLSKFFLASFEFLCNLGHQDQRSKFLSVFEQSSFGFSSAHSYCSRFWAALPIFVHTSGHTCVNLLPDHKNPLGGFSFKRVNFVKPFHESDKFLFGSTFQ